MDSLAALLAPLFRVGAGSSIPALLVALFIAVAFSLTRIRRPRSIRIAVLRRAILPGRIYRSASGRTDIAFAIFGIFIFGMAFGWTMLSATTVKGIAASLLGPSDPVHWPFWAVTLVVTVALYLSYELAYWVYHYLCHRVELLWKFHAVHHSAESLSPLTNFRVHPVDTILFGNALALFNGTTSGLLAYAFGEAHALTIDGANAIFLAASLSIGTLQHSHFWISFQGIWGKLFLSPAHHQIHHSTKPEHFNKNLGSTLAIWDWFFGTLELPSRQRQDLTFGVSGYDQPHTLRGAVLRPFVGAAMGLIRRRPILAQT